MLEVLDFVSRCAEDGLEKAVAAHGGFESVRTAGATGPIEIGMTWGFGLAGKPASERHALTWSVAIGGQSGGAAYVSIEGLVDRVDEANPRVLLDENEFNERVLHSETSDEPTTVIESVEAMRCLAFEVIADRRRFPMLAHLKSLLKDTRIVGALPTSPAWARIDTASPSPRDSVVIGPRKFIDRQGLGLANVLYTLHTDHADAWRALEGDIKGEFPFVSRITFPAEVGGSRISFAYDDTRFKGRKMYASEMSDGMVAYLCLLAAVHNPRATRRAWPR